MGFLDIRSTFALDRLNLIGHSIVHLLMFSKSEFRRCVAKTGFSTSIKKTVSSAKKIYLTLYFAKFHLYIKGKEEVLILTLV